MARLTFTNPEDMAAFSAAAGFGDNFFGSGQLYNLVELYKSERGLDHTTTQVEVTLRDGETFLVSHVRVATRYVVFYTEDDEHVCVPQAEVTKVRIGRRPTPVERHTGFSTERLPEPES